MENWVNQWGWRRKAMKKEQCPTQIWACAQSCPWTIAPWTVAPGSSVHGTFQTRILECVAISYSRGSSWDQTRMACDSCIGGRIISLCATGATVIQLSIPVSFSFSRVSRDCFLATWFWKLIGAQKRANGLIHAFLTCDQLIIDTICSMKKYYLIWSSSCSRTRMTK